MPEKPKPNLDEIAHRVIDDILDDKSKQFEIQMANQPIYVLGSHDTQKEEMDSIVKKLVERKFPAKLVREHKDRPFLPDFEKEKVVIESASVLVVLDGKIGAVVGESAYLMHCSENQHKCVLLVPEENKEKILSTKEHYLYYPTKIVYRNKNELVDLAVDGAIQTSFRLAINEVNKRGKMKQKNK
jgi:hypothetical protein